MDNKLMSLNPKDFRECNLKNIELFHDLLSKIITDSISGQTLESIEPVLETTFHNYEKIYNNLNLDKPKNALCYYFGRISSMTDISSSLLKDNLDCNSEIKICFSDLFRFLDGIIEELETENPNALNIINNCIDFKIDINEKRLLKEKLDTILTC